MLCVSACCQYEDGGLFQGRNFVFDKRVAMAPSAASPAVVGNCVDCSAPFDGFAGDVVCTVCRELVLVCPACRERDQVSLLFCARVCVCAPARLVLSCVQGEYHCSSHRELKSCYFTNLNHFTLPQLAGQLAELQSLLTVALTQGRRLKNRRRTLSRQIEKVEARISALESGEASVEARVEKCRTCGDAGCHGACWGFWARGEPGKVEVSASRRAL